MSPLQPRAFDINLLNYLYIDSFGQISIIKQEATDGTYTKVPLDIVAEVGVIPLSQALLPPATKLRQGNVFTSVCQEFCPPGGLCPSMHHRSHDQGGLCPGGLSLGFSVQGGLCMSRRTPRPLTEDPPPVTQ